MVARIWKTEEKGSEVTRDVTLGAHLVRDACQASFEEAVVLTNDPDLVEPVRIVTKEVRLPVILLTRAVAQRPYLSMFRRLYDTFNLI